jgi:hypothetical protein
MAYGSGAVLLRGIEGLREPADAGANAHTESGQNPFGTGTNEKGGPCGPPP